MVKKQKTNKIQKTTTTRIAFIGLAAATMIITVSMIGATQLQQASAAKPQYCFNWAINGDPQPPACYPTRDACENARSQTAPQYVQSGCYNENAGPQPQYCFDYTISGTTSTACYADRDACNNARSQTATEYNPTRCYRERN